MLTALALLTAPALAIVLPADKTYYTYFLYNPRMPDMLAPR